MLSIDARYASAKDAECTLCARFQRCHMNIVYAARYGMCLVACSRREHMLLFAAAAML